MIGPDTQLHGRPPCEHCKEGALCVVSGKFLCGQCVLKLEKRKQKYMMEVLEDGDVV